MPAVSERQRRFMMSDLARAKKGQPTKTGMSAQKLREYRHVAPKKVKGVTPKGVDKPAKPVKPAKSATVPVNKGKIGFGFKG